MASANGSACAEHMTFANDDTSCEQFRSNRLARSGRVARKCTDCSRDIQEHRRTAVTDAEIQKAVEADVSSPSCILGPGCGSDEASLFLGACQAAMNGNFLRSGRISLIVNTAGLLLGEMLPQFKAEGQAYVVQKSLGIETVLLEWEDSSNQVLGEAELVLALQRIDESLAAGHSVFVHCAQGRSRSSSVVVAYLVAKRGMSVDDALCFVQAQRSMAQPNDNFLKQLKAMEPMLMKVLEADSKAEL